VCAHLDQSRADEKHGHKWTFVFEGDHKAHGNPHEPLSDTAQIKMQADCALLYEMFVDLVAQNRRLNADAIRDTQAETFIGTQALKLGLADAQGTLAQALEALTDSISQTSTATKEGQNTWHAQNTALKKRKMKRSSTSSMTRKRTKTIVTSTKTPKTSTMKKTKTMRTMKTSAKI
ncbi:S49 family peptidase, partial [Bartonella sp. TS82HLJMH]|uniref:S49 family peptidase n=1 Tax=Bartonella sp. TS82HLJMH TaxID=3243577 RepID=UPI0035D11CC6